MATILDKIIESKRLEIASRKKLIPTEKLQQSIYFDGPCISLVDYVKRPDKSGVIAEFKRASPSRGNINIYADAEKIPLAYMQAGASALSVLTDENYFKGSSEDLIHAREWNYAPILRKDFIVDEYQLIEAKAIGADAILLILSTMEERKALDLIDAAHELGLEVLAEIHETTEYNLAAEKADLLGINSRSLKEMKVIKGHATSVLDDLSPSKTVIAESGIDTPEQAFELYRKGFDGFLIGTSFMQTPDPGFACRQFINHFEELKRTVKA
jgi:indole-3-glycerol phosphate synthase